MSNPNICHSFSTPGSGASVFVTGATGFIGRRLVGHLLEQGKHVRCLVRSSERAAQTLGKLSQQVELVVGDLSDRATLTTAVGDADLVYHLAGRTFGSWRQLAEVNVQGSDRLAGACASAANPPKLVVVSSLAAAGTAPAGRPRRESDPPRPVSQYGRSKRGGERAVMRWAGRVPVSIVRPGIVFGPGNREMLPMFRSIAVARVHAVPGFAPRRVSLIHVDDLIRLIERVATDGDHLTAQLDDGRPSVMGTEQGVFFAGDRQTPSLHELGRLIGRSLDLPSVLILHVAEPVALLSGALNQWLSKYRRAAESFNIDKIREAFAGDWTCCVERAERLLGFRPARTLSERMRETAQWYRDAGWLTGPANEP